MKSAWIALCLAALAQPVQAEEWPGGPIRVIVNAAPGGVADRAMRVMAPHMGEKLGAQIVVENRPGGEGYIGQQEVARARPDGHTFLLSAGSMVIITPQLVPLPDFDPRKALVPVAPAVAIPMNLLVHPSVPVETAADFINYAKAHPGKLAYGSAGSGTALHIAAETFSHEAGIRMTHVPYKGAGDALKDFLGGHVDVLFDPGLATQYIKTKRVKLLAVAGASRNPQFPDTPAMEEIGVKGVDGGPYFGIFAPRGTKPQTVRRVNEAITAVLERPELRQQLVNMSLDVAPPMSAEQFEAYLRNENTRYERLLPKLGIRGQ
ncbi:tripartite tricarboxylate transporter substrate binding protein [Pigmentiphaga sp. H8]|uniref:Bug family tripartite tricarboxylate transporter substrate binding protein n=1 Tax=Pigmentiphaga sp. H8 TaxID=2488560 RepID=UPI0013756613|nr:tripartite tricarboxylate transporter substrate binding protein [Pigmentiphaga sp. H8]